MYKYSNGVNLVAGGEKHRIYVKKSPTGVGKGVKGHVMVNHPTEDKGKWDTIDLTEKAGAKTVEEGKAATKKWHAENPYLYGAKSVKQYRGDENLPEAKKGMKNCGCKHPKTKYKYGTGTLTIPEGSAIVTANGGKNKQAIAAYKKGNYKLLNNIIDDMPEDRVDKADGGKKVTKVKGKYTTTDPTTKETYQEQSVLGGRGYGREMPLDRAQNLYNLSDEEFEKIYGKNKNSDLYKIEKGRREAVKEGNVTYTVEGKKGKDGKPLKYASGYRSKPGEGEKAKEEEKPKETSTTTTTTTTEDKGTGNNDTFAGNKRKGNFLANIPSLAEIAAKASILGQGVENVPENYLTLGRYRYVSQLPQTLREIQLAEQSGREIARDIVGGDAGRYLAQVGSLSASRMEAANKAVIEDTLARQQEEINRNIAQGDREAEVNLGLRNQYAQQRAMNRGAYNNMLVSLGQSIDSATDATKLMASQRNVDDIRMNLLKSKDYYMDSDGNIRMGKNGIKKVKTYKRK